jgi:hypothetical protein
LKIKPTDFAEQPPSDYQQILTLIPHALLLEQLKRRLQMSQGVPESRKWEMSFGLKCQFHVQVPLGIYSYFHKKAT